MCAEMVKIAPTGIGTTVDVNGSGTRVYHRERGVHFWGMGGS